MKQLEGVSILIVEDHADSLEALCALLGMHGATVTGAPTGQAAMAAFVRARPDIVVADMGLPDVEGTALIAAIRRLAPEDGGAVPAIALSARYSGSEESLRHGFDHFVEKPHVDMLLPLLIDLANKKRNLA